VEGAAAAQTAAIVIAIAIATGTATETGTVIATETGSVTANLGRTGIERTGRGTIAGAEAGAVGGGAAAAGAGKVVAETATGVEAVVDAAEAEEAAPFRQTLCQTGLEATQMVMGGHLGPFRQIFEVETGCAQSATSTTTDPRLYAHSVPPRCHSEGARHLLEEALQAIRNLRRVAEREEASGMMTAVRSRQRKCPSGSKIWCQRRSRGPGHHQALIRRTSR